MDIINKIEPSGTQRETLQKNCKPLYDYVRYVSKIKENKKLNMPTEEAVNKAVTNETSSVAESTDLSDSVSEDNDKSAKSNGGDSGKGSFPFVPVVVGAVAVAAAIGAGVAIAKMKKKKD